MKASNVAAFTVSTLLAAGTVASVVATATAVSTVAIVAYSALALTLGGLSIASVTAWIDKKSKDVNSYFETFGGHAGCAVAAIYQFAAHTMLQALVQGMADAVRKLVSQKIASPDVTVQRT